jgi:molecular chaperone GrpE
MKNKKDTINTDKTEDFIETNMEELSSEEVINETIDSETIVDEAAKYNDLNDRFLRLHAEFDNYRKRSNREKVDLISSANAGLLKDLLPILDDFERGMTNNLESSDVSSVKEGFTLIFNKFKGIIESKGVKAMECKNQVFDSEFHEAIVNLPVDDPELKGKIIEDIEKGYTLNDKVIRFAKVVVGQ